MPIYEYECGACGRFEVMQKITENPLKKCDKCGGPIHKLVSHSSFTLKGGGWYKDLYSSAGSSSKSASSKGRSASSSSSGTSSSSSSGTSSSSDSGSKKSEGGKSNAKSSSAAA